jgi:hypothetical protein
MTPATVADALQLANGISTAETDRIIGVLGRLDERLRSFAVGTVRLQLSVKERGTPSQRTRLEARIARRPRLVATSSRADFDGALAEVRDGLIRQITDAKNRTEPRNSRRGRQSLGLLRT